MTEVTPRPRIRRRRVVERPRLIAVLDRSRARLRTLVAGPGFGKTVLLEQWAAGEERRIGWYRARRSATDVAVVARELQAAIAPILPGAGRRMLERLSVTEDPEREAVLLGEMLAEDVVDWPTDAWIVIDDYEHLAVAEGPERFVEVLALRSPMQLLIASRVRPAWVHGKALLYGDVLEVTQAMLAMTTEEAAEVLEGGRLDLSSGLLTLADGWPAVIGLAGMAPDVTEIDADMPESLYAFFAEEVLRGLDPDLADALAILAAMPMVDRELAGLLLGADRASRVCEEALALGILDEREGRLELHPLAARFMARAARQDGVPGIREALAPALVFYRRRKDWDSAIEVTATFGDPAALAPLLLELLEELLAESRLAALEACTAIVADRDETSLVVQLARACLALRQGLTLRAEALAALLLDSREKNLQLRGALVAGAAAHAGSREEAALQFFEIAEGLASDGERRRDAQWGQLMAATALELPGAPAMLANLIHRSGSRVQPFEAVREADKKLALGLRFGSVDSLAESRQATELLIHVRNPVARVSFLATFSCALNLAAEYAEALEAATVLCEQAAELRIDFALPYGSMMKAAALAGLRRTEEAHDSLSLALVEARRCSDAFAEQGIYASRVRLLIQEGRHAEACALEPPDLAQALPGMRGEVMATRGLALACIGRLSEALELKKSAEEATAAIESSILTLCIGAVVAIKRRDDELYARLKSMVDEAYARGGVDLVITTYRACPPILDALLRRHETAEITGYIVARARDEDLAGSLGIGVGDALDPISTLTPRELEIYDLACQGLSNKQIASMLFISVETAKLHLHRVYRKFGVNSRTALLGDWRARRSGQAAPSATSSLVDES
jgi:LuxR family maltose regulon positive regulatory protein